MSEFVQLYKTEETLGDRPMYPRVLAKLGGQLAQADALVPIRVCECKPVKPRENELTLWTNDTWAFVEYQGVRSVVTGPEIVDLLLLAQGECELERA